jgi:outer membrane receptor protein involved in Fe transport
MNRVKDHSAEAIVDWNPAGPARLVGGISYLGARLDQFIDLSQVIGFGEFDDRQSSVGLFGEASLQPIPRIIVSAGLRYQRDSQRRKGSAGTTTSSVPLDYDETFSAWLPKLSVTYDFADALRAGLLLQRAYNPGGTTLRFDTAQPETFGSESLWNYELFFRASPAPRLSLSANLFHTKMRNSQRARTIPFRIPGGPTAFFAAISNVPRARTYGAELTAEWRPSERLSARAALGLLDTKILATAAVDDPALGKQFQRSPHLTASMSIDWRPLKSLRLSAQARHNSRYFSDDFESPDLRVGRATIVDVRAAWDRKRFTLFGYIRNLFDEFELRSFSSSTAATAIDPREFGVGIEGNF